jgi:hypothetical protein
VWFIFCGLPYFIFGAKALEKRHQQEPKLIFNSDEWLLGLRPCSFKAASNKGLWVELGGEHFDDVFSGLVVAFD